MELNRALDIGRWIALAAGAPLLAWLLSSLVIWPSENIGSLVLWTFAYSLFFRGLVLRGSETSKNFFSVLVIVAGCTLCFRYWSQGGWQEDANDFYHSLLALVALMHATFIGISFYHHWHGVGRTISLRGVLTGVMAVCLGFGVFRTVDYYFAPAEHKMASLRTDILGGMYSLQLLDYTSTSSHRLDRSYFTVLFDEPQVVIAQRIEEEDSSRSVFHVIGGDSKYRFRHTLAVTYDGRGNIFWRRGDTAGQRLYDYSTSTEPKRWVYCSRTRVLRIEYLGNTIEYCHAGRNLAVNGIEWSTNVDQPHGIVLRVSRSGDVIEEDWSITERPPPLFDATRPRTPLEARAAQNAWARHLDLPRVNQIDVNDRATMMFILIPPGEFLMGSPSTDAESNEDEAPQLRVRFTKPFYFGMTEVTKDEWQALMGDTEPPWQGSAYAGDSMFAASNHVSWFDAQGFCRKLGENDGNTYRLPTEAEWEYACRAGTTTRFHFGDDEEQLGAYAWFHDNAREMDANHFFLEPNQKLPNPFGLYDMYGNVSEWCQDWYDAAYYRSVAPSTAVDPSGPSRGSERVHRGGAWSDSPASCRSAFRDASVPDDRGRCLGFRVVWVVDVE